MTLYNKNYFTEFIENSGNKNMTGDYSGAVTDFVFTPSQGGFLIRVNIFIEDASSMSTNTYGGISALSNGIRFFVEKNIVKKYLNTEPIVSNYQYDLLGDVKYESPLLGNNFMIVSFHFDNIRFTFDTNDNIGMELNDNFAGLVKHYCTIQGFYF